MILDHSLTLLTILGVMEICSFKSVPEEKTGREIPDSSRLEFLENFLANNFASSDAEGNTSGPLNRGGIADLPLLKTLLAIYQKSWEPSFWEVMDCCVSSICKFGSFKNHFATITRLSELYFRFRRFILLIQTKKVISLNYGGSTGCWKPWRLVRFDLILWWGIYTWTHTQNSLAVAEALSLKISSHGTSLNDHKDHPNQLENSHNPSIETGHPVLSLLES